MNLDVALIVFQVAVLIFAFSMHEAAHAWAAWKLGDPTAMMLGRITLNPVKHIDPLGSVVMPLIAMFSGLPLIGWAKPCPVTTRNFRRIVRDDILTTLAGPASNLLAAIVCLVLLVVLEHSTTGGYLAVMTAAKLAFHVRGVTTEGLPALFPVALLLYFGIWVNSSLFVFNLIPLPPLDGSRVFRYILPYAAQRMYDRLGMFSLLILMFVGGRLLSIFFYPMVDLFNHVLGLG